MKKFWPKFFRHVYSSKPVFYTLLFLFILMIFSSGFRLGREWSAYLNRIATAQTFQSSHATSANSLPTSTSMPPNWNTYKSEKMNFMINYPKKIGNEIWQYEEFDENKSTLLSIGFGPISSKPGGYVWGVTIYGDQSIEQLIKQQGSQFSDRKEIRENIVINNRPATLITVTTQQFPNWVSKTVLIKINKNIYVIQNGASQISGFDTFYQSFSSTKL